MRILLAGGGTAGHVYPALSVAEALRRCAGGPHELLFAGTERGEVRRLALQTGVPFVEVRSAPVRGRSPLALVRSMRDLCAGTVQSGRMLRRFRPNVVLATGGYATVPVAFAAALRRVPIVLYLPDVYPGWAVRLLAPLAARIAVSGDGALDHLPRRKCVVTGYPIRAAFFTAEREAARLELGFSPDVPLLLVTGASQGSHTINLAVFAALPALLPRCAVLHQTGSADLAAAEERAAAAPYELRDRYRPVAYIEDMAGAMVAADLAVMRSGASSLAEPPAAGLPAVLVPGTFAGAHQRHNAAFMAERGAAVLLEESDLGRLADVVLALLGDHERLAAMAAATARLARRDAAEAIAGVVLEAAA